MTIQDTVTCLNPSPEQLLLDGFSAVISTLAGEDSDIRNKLSLALQPMQAILTQMIDQRTKELDDAREVNRQLSNKVSDAEDRVCLADQKISKLHDKLSQQQRYICSTQIDMVRGNVMIRTTKSPKDVSDFISTTIAKSGAPKPSPYSFYIQQIRTEQTDKDNKSPKKGKKDKDKSSGEVNLFKVHLGGKLKNDLFKGLSAASPTRASASQDFLVSHDVPIYLYKQRNLLEKAAYSLRKEHKDKAVKTKVVLKGRNMALFTKTKDAPDWTKIDRDSDKNSVFSTTKVEYKDGEDNLGNVGELLSSLEIF